MLHTVNVTGCCDKGQKILQGHLVTILSPPCQQSKALAAHSPKLEKLLKGWFCFCFLEKQTFYKYMMEQRD